MILKYGTYAHSLDECSVVINHESNYSANRVLTSTVQRWSITGELLVSSTLTESQARTALTTAITALTTAYAKNNQDITLYLADGTTATAHRIRNAETIGGVRVVKPPSFPIGQGYEYGYSRTYSIEIEAEMPAGDVGIIDWEETITLVGGGPRFAMLPTLNGQPVKQILQQQTPYMATQSGRALGFLSYPIPAAPLWPQHEHREARQITRRVPRKIGTGSGASYREFETSWSYSFESTSSLTGNPTIQP